MKEYPSISREHIKDMQAYVFDKLDGSLFRTEWSAKRGFYKFGTKTQLIDKNTPVFGAAVDIFINKYEYDLNVIFNKLRWRNVVCFCEFYGPASFAGNHKPDEKHDVVLFDVGFMDNLNIILDPREFIDYFGNLSISKLLYQGKVNEELIQLVHNSQLENMTFEGCVVKGFYNHKRDLVPMFKIKSNAWIEKLKSYCNNNMDLFARLL